MSASTAGFDRLVAGLEEAGYLVAQQGPGQPRQLIVNDPEARSVRLIAAWIFELRPGGHRPRETGMRIRLPPPARQRRYEDEERLVLGYHRELDVFSGWPAEDGGGGGRQALWVPEATLAEAARSGYARPRPGSFAFAFRPDQIRRYVDDREAWVPPWTGWVAAGSSGRPVERALTYDYIAGAGGGSGGSGRAEEVESAAEESGSARPEVETGFARIDGLELLSPDTPLESGSEYLFWFAVGAETGASIGTSHVTLPEGLRSGTRLTIQLFAFEGELELVGRARGEIELQPDGRALALDSAAARKRPSQSEDRLLFLPVRTPELPGVYRLRCSVYYGSTLLQSWLISAAVGEGGGKGPPLLSDLDYAITSELDLERIARVPAHDLSVMINGGGGPAPSHDFRFFGAGGEEVIGSASVGEAQIANAIRTTRGALRKASWGTEDEWVTEKYLYSSSSGTVAQLTADLVRLAIRGARLYVDIAGELASSTGGRKELEQRMRRPGRIQIATLHEGLYLPAGLFYDHPIEQAPSEQSMARMKLCNAFLATLGGSGNVEDCACAQGECPNYGDRYVVCPSGFWGYRHQIGWLASADEPLTKVELDGRARMLIGVSTAGDLEHRKEHVEVVEQLGAAKLAESREEFVALAKSNPGHLVYFYCHGGLTTSGGVPFLELGPANSDGLSRGYLVEEGILWEDPPQPLVFINGCHTTALDPETLGSLVAGFVRDAKALGVLGTEVTIFEPLACAFALSVLGNYLDGTMTIGEAVKRARFDLLRSHNPLGLVYVPLVAAETQLVRAAP